MTRTVLLTATAPASLPGTVLTLNRRAAKKLGVRPLRLNDLPMSVVRDAGIELSSAALSQRVMTGVVRQHLTASEPGVMASALLGVARELLRSAADLHALTQSTSTRVAQLACLTLAYQTALKERSLIDPAEVTIRATELVKPQLLSLSGYPRLLRDEQIFLNVACAEGSILHLPWVNHPYFQENLEAAQYFESQGWTVQRDESPSSPLASALLGKGQGSGTLHVLTSEDQEVRTALGHVKSLLLNGVSAQDIVLVVPDDELWGGQIQAIANEYGLPIRLTTSVPASQTRLGRWILRAVTTIEEGLTFETVTRLLAHPLDMGMDGAQWQEVRRARPTTPAEWHDVGVNLRHLQWPIEASREQWVELLLALMDDRGVTERSSHGLDQVVMNFIRAELLVIGTPHRENLSRAQFFEELRDLLGLVTVPSQLGTRGVELLTPPALIGAEVPHVFFLGLTDGSLPAPLSDDPTLDFLERKRLHTSGVAIETAGTLSRRHAVTFWGALQAAGEATFSYARLAPGGSGLPSPYLSNLGLTETIAPRYACSPEEARQVALRGKTPYEDDLLDEARRKHKVEVARLQDPTYSEFDGLNLPPVEVSEKVFSASQLSTLGRCGFRWWLEYGLKLTDDLNEPRVATLGRLRHEVLKRATVRAAQTPETDVREVMLQNLEPDWQQVETELDWPLTPDWERERLEHLELLRRAIQSPDFLTPGARPKGAEQDFTGEWMGLQVRGTVDRVDELNGKAIVVDYKSGASKPMGVQDLEHRLKLDLQLGIYVQTAVPKLYSDLKPGGAMYLSLRNGQVLDRLKVNMTEFKAFAERVTRMLQEGSFPPRPDADLKACQFCGWQATCRSGVRLERKEFE